MIGCSEVARDDLGKPDGLLEVLSADDTEAEIPDRVEQRLQPRLAAVQLGDWEEVVDPGGGDAEDFLACAQEIVELVGRLVPALT